MAADEGVRLLVEQTDGELSPAQKSAAMKSAVEKRTIALRQKMGKLVAVANPDLTEGWLQEVCGLYFMNEYSSIRTWAVFLSTNLFS